MQEHRSDHQVGILQLLPDGVPSGEEQLHVGGHHLFEVPKAGQIDVHDAHAGAHARGETCRMGTHDATPQDENLAGQDAGNAPKQYAATSGGLLQVLGPLLHRHAACHLAHGREQRQLMARQLHRLVGDADGTRVHAGFGQRFRRCEVEVREYHLVLPHPRPLGLDGLFDFHDHLGPGPHLLGRVDDLRPGRGVEVVRESASDPGSGLQHHRVSGSHERLGPGRSKGHPVLVGLDLRGHANQHGS